MRASPLPKPAVRLFWRDLASCLLLCLLCAACVGVKYTDQPTSIVDLTVAERSQTADSRVLAKAEEWRNSGVLVRKGETYVLNATGRWHVWGTCPWTDADGLNMYGPLCFDWGNAFLKGWSHAALIAKIGESGAPFGVGKSLRFTAPEDGVLFFIINDTPGHFWDNEGYVDVSISLARGPGAAQAPVAQTPAPAAPEGLAVSEPPAALPQWPGIS